MAAIITKRNGSTAKSQRGSEESALTKWILISVALAFVGVFLLLPLINVFYQAFSKGWALYKESLLDPNTIASIKLTLFIAAISVPLNLIFGLAASWAIAKFEFPGKAFLITLIDLPFAVSPVVAGLMFVVLFGREGFFGEWLDARDIKIIFAWPGMMLATVFITFPFVARELIPVMQATGSEQEQAALTLGASGWKTFWFVTLPSVKWGLIYGVILCNARAMGEFGAVSVVSGHIEGITDTMPLRVDKLFHGASESSGIAAFVVASLLAVLALITLVLKTILEWKQERDFARAQQTAPDDMDMSDFASSDTVILAKSLQQ
jgi:sulfate transport system permease protein